MHQELKESFRNWRDGDASAGQQLAQIMTDWYFAVSTSRLGEPIGAEPYQTACGQFAHGVMDIQASRDLIPWAHELIRAAVDSSGGRTVGADIPSSFTGDRHPTALLQLAREALPEEVDALLKAYDPESGRAKMGDLRLLLQYRYRLKRWLRDYQDVQFEVTPVEPNPDWLPVPVFEADKMAGTQEEQQFELWMLADRELCRDLAEFAHFAIVLRAGSLPASTSTSSKKNRSSDAGSASEGPKSGASTTWAIAAVVLVALTAAAAISWYAFGG